MNKLIQYIKRMLIVLGILQSLPLSAQYFGQNKVMYDRFNFDIYSTPHFRIYQYLDNDSLLYNFGQQSERWYLRHQAIFSDTVKANPMILYNNRPDFMQTTVISGMIGVGTGGVTEAFRTRVVMPVMESNRETDHVLGHEMVHVFQYNVIKKDDSLSLQSLSNVPLWMIEGMAEFLSIGSRDNRTAMWMRDALIHDDIPTIKEMTRNPYQYFPYRYGHALWAFITGIYGDGIIRPLLYNTAKYGLEMSMDSLLYLSPDSLSTLWENSIDAYYSPLLKDTIAPVGEKIFGLDNAGNINLSPVISPDGSQMTLLSNKDVITIDILLADASNGNIIKKLTSTVKKTHIDDFNFIESAGSWSPDASKYVLTTFTKGSNSLLIANVKGKRVKTIQEIKIEGIDAFSNPEWSPDGKTILFTGLVDGQSDLYLYDLNKQKTEQLTNDLYSDIQATYTADGKQIAFISDRGHSTNLDKQIYGNYEICILDIESGEIDILPLFANADVYSPQFSPKDTSIYFLSNVDGFRNLYRYNFASQKIYRLTKFATGITGITDLSPSYSVARETGEIAYTLYQNDNYIIYKANPEDFLNCEVNPYESNFEASQLPPSPQRMYDVVDNNLKAHPSQPVDSFSTKPYDSKFQLEYLGASGLGVGASQYGAVAAGGVAALFSDMLKYHQIYTVLQINGEIWDIGGLVSYLNSKKRINWGASYSHIPYRSSYLSYKLDSLKSGDDYFLVDNYVIERIRIFEDQVSLFGQYPLSSKIRFEAGASFTRYSYRIDSINNYYSGGLKVHETKKNVDGPEPFLVGRNYLALVGDNANYGITSPLNGFRYRFQVEQFYARYNTAGLLADFRKYFFMKPINLSFRAYHYGRYFGNANELYPFYVGYDFFVRGYTWNAFDNNFCETDECLDINSLTGSKILVANAEIRLPFTGPRRLSLIKSGYLYSDLIFFFDGGLAWRQGFIWQDRANVDFVWEPSPDKRIPVFSSGISLRVNLFGYAVLEPYVAMPFQLKGKDFVFGLSFSGGGW